MSVIFIGLIDRKSWPLESRNFPGFNQKFLAVEDLKFDDVCLCVIVVHKLNIYSNYEDIGELRVSRYSPECFPFVVHWVIRVLINRDLFESGGKFLPHESKREESKRKVGEERDW